MLEKIKILKEATTKVYPYFTPSWHNCLRTVGFFSTIILLPIATIIMPMLLFRREENSSLEDKSNNTDLMTLLASAFTVALLNGAQKGISLMLEVSTMHAMMEHNTRRLMDHSKFLIHGDNKDIKSFQYITVGLGIEDFTENVIPIFTELPTYIISSVSTLTYIGITTKSFVTSGIVLGFTVSSGIATYLLSRIYSGYRASNQKIENNLVVKVSFIEAHKSAITLMGTSDQECASVINNLQKIKASIPKLSTIYFVNFFLNTIAPAIASQFLGKYYVDYPDKNLSDTNTAILNIMIMSLLTNMQNIVFILTNNYSYIKLNLEQLRAFERSYDECLLIRNTHNKMTQEFIGDKLALLDFSVYKPDTTNFQGEEPITLLNKVTLELLPNKIYKLFAESGKGKTTFLKAITNNWQYTNGEVKFPANAKDNICFIPQHSFIPIGTLVEILTYGIPQKALENDSMTELVIHNTTPLLNNESTIIKTQRFVIDTFINKAKHLLNKVGLLPNIIKEDELESKSINWNERLSGGEKQKIGIIRAILSNSVFIIMDEAATALDVENKRTVYKILKDHVTKLANYTVIYTDHSDIEDFKDAVITINGQNLECEYIA